MSEPLFCSYYTTAYEAHAAALVRTLERHALDHLVLPESDHGSWQANTQAKPNFLLGCMLHHPGRVIVWIDADARVEQFPQVLFDLAEAPDWDVAYHVFRLTGGREEALSGTVAVNSSAFLGAWSRACLDDPGIYDQVCMERAARRYRVRELPGEYCWIDGIFDQPYYARNNPNVGAPTIRHLQASRALRHV